MDPDSDKKISEHVLRMHRYRNPGEQDGDRKQNCSEFCLLSYRGHIFSAIQIPFFGSKLYSSL